MNDLVGLEYGWGCKPVSGKTDCWQLVVEVRTRLGLETPDFEWVYRLWDDKTLDPRLIGHWLTEYCTPCAPEPGAIAAIPSPTHGTALGVCTGASLLFISSTGRVVSKPISRVTTCVRFFHTRNS